MSSELSVDGAGSCQIQMKKGGKLETIRDGKGSACVGKEEVIGSRRSAGKRQVTGSEQKPGHDCLLWQVVVKETEGMYQPHQPYQPLAAISFLSISSFTRPSFLSSSTLDHHRRTDPSPLFPLSLSRDLSTPSPPFLSFALCASSSFIDTDT